MGCKYLERNKCSISSQYVSNEIRDMYCDYGNEARCTLFAQGIHSENQENQKRLSEIKKQEVRQRQITRTEIIENLKMKQEYYHKEFLYMEGKHDHAHLMYDIVGDIVVAETKKMNSMII